MELREESAVFCLGRWEALATPVGETLGGNRNHYSRDISLQLPALWILECELGKEAWFLSFFLFSPPQKDGYQCFSFRVLAASGGGAECRSLVGSGKLIFPEMLWSEMIYHSRLLWLESKTGGSGLWVRDGQRFDSEEKILTGSRLLLHNSIITRKRRNNHIRCVLSCWMWLVLPCVWSPTGFLWVTCSEDANQ